MKPAQHFRISQKASERLCALSARTRVPKATWLDDAVDAVMSEGEAGPVTWAPRLKASVFNADIVHRLTQERAQRLAALSASTRASKSELVRAGLELVLKREGA